MAGRIVDNPLAREPQMALWSGPQNPIKLVRIAAHSMSSREPKKFAAAAIKLGVTRIIDPERSATRAPVTSPRVRPIFHVLPDA